MISHGWMILYFVELRSDLAHIKELFDGLLDVLAAPLFRRLAALEQLRQLQRAPVHHLLALDAELQLLQLRSRQGQQAPVGL